MLDTPTLILVALFAEALGAAPLDQHPGAWVHAVDDDWTVAVNGHGEPVEWNGAEVEPFGALVEWRGMPAGAVNFFGGAMAAGPEINKAAFRAALIAATQRAEATR